MLKHLFIPGLQYEGESAEDMDRRETAMAENNRRVDELWADWERQKATPMNSMKDWAAQRGIGPNEKLTDCGRERASQPE